MAPQPLRDVAVLCLDTGLRVSEALNLSGENVNLEQGHLDVRSGKSRKAARRLPLSPHVIEMLRSRQGVHSVLVFPGRPLKRLNGQLRPFTVEALDKQHNALRRLLKLPTEFVIHSLRHTFGTLLGDCGVPSFLIKKIMGHSTVTVSARYIHPSEEAVERAFEQLQERRQPATVSATVVERPSVSH